MFCIYSFIIYQIINRWYAHLKIFESLDRRVLWSYYEAAASIFEPERRNERISWAKTVVMLNIITSFFARPQLTNADMKAFADEFSNPKCHQKGGKPWHMILNALHRTLNQISSEARIAHGVDIHLHLHHAVSSILPFITSIVHQGFVI